MSRNLPANNGISKIILIICLILCLVESVNFEGKLTSLVEEINKRNSHNEDFEEQLDAKIDNRNAGSMPDTDDLGEFYHFTYHSMKESKHENFDELGEGFCVSKDTYKPYEQIRAPVDFKSCILGCLKANCVCLSYRGYPEPSICYISSGDSTPTLFKSKNTDGFVTYINKNINLSSKVKKCVADIRTEYESVVDMSIEGTPQPYDVASTVFIGNGNYGIVVKDNQNPNQQVTKIGKHEMTMDASFFPREYCLNVVAKSPYITKVIIDTFKPWEVNVTQWNEDLDTYFHMEKYKFKDACEVNKRCFLPSFNLLRCDEFPWERLKQTHSGKEQTILIHMTYALHHIHQVSGINLQDINAGNIMLCNKQLTYSDLGLARILYNDYSDLSGGTDLYKPPWKDVMTQFGKINSKYKDKGTLAPEWKSNFDLEREGASDYWGIAILFMTKMCTIENDDILERFTALKTKFNEILKKTIIEILTDKTIIEPKAKFLIIDLMNAYINEIKELLNESNCSDEDNILGRLLVENPHVRLTNADWLYRQLVANQK